MTGADGRQTRREVLRLGLGAGAAVAVSVGAAGCSRGTGRASDRQPQAALDEIPHAPEGVVRLDTVHSAARGQTVQLFTAVPAGHGDGAGLPVCLVLHGASATAADLRPFGFGRFLTAAVGAGAAPFVLAGADGGRNLWKRQGADDPQRMLVEEMPVWLASRGFDATLPAAFGWSMGGYGSLLLAAAHPRLLSGVAALSPALSTGDDVSAAAGRLEGPRIGLWCGAQDGFAPAVRAFAAALPGGPAVASFPAGAHTRIFWNSVTLDALRFVGSRIAATRRE